METACFQAIHRQGSETQMECSWYADGPVLNWKKETLPRVQTLDLSVWNKQERLFLRVLWAQNMAALLEWWWRWDSEALKNPDRSFQDVFPSTCVYFSCQSGLSWDVKSVNIKQSRAQRQPLLSCNNKTVSAHL